MKSFFKKAGPKIWEGIKEYGPAIAEGAMMCLLVEENSGNPYYIRIDCIARLNRMLRDMKGLLSFPGIDEIH